MCLEGKAEKYERRIDNSELLIKSQKKRAKGILIFQYMFLYAMELPYMLKNKKPTRCHLLFLFLFLDTQYVSGINVPIFRSLRLCC